MCSKVRILILDFYRPIGRQRQVEVILTIS